MHKILQKLETYSCQKLHWWVVVLSIVVAAQVQYIQHGWINPDSVLYLEAANLFIQGAWQAGFDVFNWPLYALCIAFVSKISMFNAHLSAQILNVLFFSIATFSFVQIIQLTGGKQRQIIAGALIWLSAQYMIGGVLEMLMRDEGFWAFFLLSLVFFIQFYKTGQLKHALLWQTCIIIATLFRIEAILYLLLLPAILLFQAKPIWQQKISHFLQAHSINITLAVIITGIFTTNGALSTKLLGRLNEIFTSNLWQQFILQLQTKSQIMSTQVLGQYLDEFALPGLLLTFIYVVCAKTISTTGLINIGLAGMFIKQQQKNKLMNAEAYRVLLAAAFIALLSMLLIITKAFVLSGRYVLALSFILMVFATFYLAELFSHLQSNTTGNKRMNWLVTALILFMVLSSIKNLLPKQKGYNYQQDAVAWLQANNTQNKPVFYDEARMRYYAHAEFLMPWSDNWSNTLSLIASKEIYQYDYLLINFTAKQASKKLQFEQQLPDYHNINNFYDVKAKKHTAVYIKISTK